MGQPHNTFAAVLAGGSGRRMGNPDKPKQFLMLGEKPILAHTVEKLCAVGAFDKVVVACPGTWVRQAEDVLKKYAPAFCEEVDVIAGGSTRNDTVAAAIAHIKAHYPVDEQTIFLTHDAVRPFVSQRIIAENLTSAREFGACDTVVPATDTIVESTDGETISAIPNRRDLYQGQTPQTFKLLELERLMGSLTDEERLSLTDACKIYTLRGKTVALVAGDAANIKITFPHDMRIASALLGE